MKKESIFLIIGIIVLAVVLTIFITGESEGAEIAIVLILGIASFVTIRASFKSGNKTNWKMVRIGVLGLAITAGLVAWSTSNSASRSDKEFHAMKERSAAYRAERDREDSIRHIEDSIRHYEDSVITADESRKLYEKEGDTIFGKFLFGMSKKDFDVIKSRIERETSGIISISGYDFRIDDYKFHNNKLYELHLKWTKSWTRYYYLDVHEYEENNNGAEIVDIIKESFSKKYGPPNDSFRCWHYNHKDINIYATADYKDQKGLLSTESWSVFISFTDPVTQGMLYKAKQQEKEKNEQERKKIEEEIQKKKESFGGGL